MNTNPRNQFQASKLREAARLALEAHALTSSTLEDLGKADQLTERAAKLAKSVPAGSGVSALRIAALALVNDAEKAVASWKPVQGVSAPVEAGKPTPTIPSRGGPVILREVSETKKTTAVRRPFVSKPVIVREIG